MCGERGRCSIVRVEEGKRRDKTDKWRRELVCTIEGNAGRGWETDASVRKKGGGGSAQRRRRTGGSDDGRYLKPGVDLARTAAVVKEACDFSGVQLPWASYV
jgi:hypothetical protein